jgi:transposase
MTKTLALTNNGATITRKIRKRLGRKSLYSAKLQKRICKLLEKGNTIIATAESCGISEATYYDWCEQKPQFLQATSRARGKVRIAHIKAITEAGKTDWKARAWLLSRVYGLEYSENTTMQIDSRFCGVLVLPEKEQLPP